MPASFKGYPKLRQARQLCSRISILSASPRPPVPGLSMARITAAIIVRASHAQLQSIGFNHLANECTVGRETQTVSHCQMTPRVSMAMTSQRVLGAQAKEHQECASTRLEQTIVRHGGGVSTWVHMSIFALYSRRAHFNIESRFRVTRYFATLPSI